MTAPEATVLAFDVGGSHIAAALCSLANLRILHRDGALLDEAHLVGAAAWWRRQARKAA
ncbi:MAG TPA: hypothetical protein VG893_12285 [Terracidiphilus sp.]|nr:hypothetical protein [Terracidiphilus sp.]